MFSQWLAEYAPWMHISMNDMVRFPPITLTWCGLLQYNSNSNCIFCFYFVILLHSLYFVVSVFLIRTLLSEILMKETLFSIHTSFHSKSKTLTGEKGKFHPSTNTFYNCSIISIHFFLLMCRIWMLLLDLEYCLFSLRASLYVKAENVSPVAQINVSISQHGLLLLNFQQWLQHSHIWNF